MDSCPKCRQLLSEGLDLCVRARALDAQERTQSTLDVSSDPEEWMRYGTFDRFVENHNARRPQSPITTRSGTPALWIQEQYDKDLFEWEKQSRAHLMEGCKNGSAEIIPVRKSEFRKGRKQDAPTDQT